jgi:hypothetical protein
MSGRNEDAISVWFEMLQPIPLVTKHHSRSSLSLHPKSHLHSTAQSVQTISFQNMIANTHIADYSMSAPTRKQKPSTYLVLCCARSPSLDKSQTTVHTFPASCRFSRLGLLQNIITDNLSREQYSIVVRRRAIAIVVLGGRSDLTMRARAEAPANRCTQVAELTAAGQRVD